MSKRSSGSRGWQIGLAATVAYLVLVHWSATLPHAGSFRALLAAAPVVLVVLLLAARSRQPRLALGSCLAAAVLAAWNWPAMAAQLHWAFILEHAGSMGFLAQLFGRSLLPGREPLCTGFARILDGPPDPAVRRYTRWVTQAWTALFAGIGTISVLLWWRADFETWSAFANLLTLPLTGAALLLEGLLRPLILPAARLPRLADFVRIADAWPEIAGRAGSPSR